MNQTPPETIILPELNSDGNGMVGVHTGNAVATALQGIFGLDHKGFGFLLNRVFTLALDRAGLIDGQAVGFTGTLRDGIFMASTHEPLAAAKIILAELKAVCLLDVCQVGILTASGWACVHPAGETKLNWLLDVDRTLLVDEQFLNELLLCQAEFNKRIDAENK